MSKPAKATTQKKLGRPFKDADLPRVEVQMSVGATEAEKARFVAGAKRVRKRSLSNYLRELLGLKAIV
jgi:hypothetical protein